MREKQLLVEELLLRHLDGAYNLARWIVESDGNAQAVGQEAYSYASERPAEFCGADVRIRLLGIVRNRAYGLIQGRCNLSQCKEANFLDKVLAFDDEIAKYLYSPERLLPTYSKSQITDLRNNYNGATPDPGYIPNWQLTLKGLASGTAETLAIQDLRDRSVVQQITRLVCVEGWSGVGWWAGIVSTTSCVGFHQLLERSGRAWIPR